MIEILYEDAGIIVCIKPRGMISEAGGLPDALETQTGAAKIYCVHRLDRDVSGVMVCAKDSQSAGKIRLLEKEYLAVTEGIPTPPRGEMHDLLFHDRARNKTYVVTRKRAGVKEASLSYEVQAEGGDFCLVKLLLDTGRTHQIRVQLASRHCPICGDGKYGAKTKGAIALLCRRIDLLHPATGKKMTFVCPLPGDGVWAGLEAETNA